LALQVVLPHLAAKTSAEVLNELRRGRANIDADPGGDPVLAHTRSLMACIDYSHSNLDPEAQTLLACFAPFTGVMDIRLLERFRTALAAEPALANLPLNKLGDVLECARGLGLLQRDANIQFLLYPQPALSWFLTHRLATAELAERRQAIERAFRQLYDRIASVLSTLQHSNQPEHLQAAQDAIEQEYANLGTALHLALDQQASIIGFYAVLSSHLERLQDHRRALELGELVLAHLERLPKDAITGQRDAELLEVIDMIAKNQLFTRDFERARANYEKALALLDGLGLNPHLAGLVRASILNQLGIVAQQQHRFPEAEAAYKQALATFLDCNGFHGAAGTFQELGIVAQQQHRFPEAEAAYKQALAIFLDFNDRHHAASSDWWIVATNSAHSPTIACCQSHLNAGGRWSCMMMSGLTRELLKSGKPLARGVAATELLMS
jgi:tetratricopeptide (TPR) repeat protein